MIDEEYPLACCAESWISDSVLKAGMPWLTSRVETHNHGRKIHLSVVDPARGPVPRRSYPPTRCCLPVVLLCRITKGRLFPCGGRTLAHTVTCPHGDGRERGIALSTEMNWVLEYQVIVIAFPTSDSLLYCETTPLLRMTD
jgi:hypothetical protein